MIENYVLEVRGISKAFPGVQALDQVSIAFKAGEVHTIMGENGAGKSTLVKILMGIYHADQGQIFLDGKEIKPQNPKQAMEMGISMVHQELNPVLDMQVAENIFLGREPKKGPSALRIVDKRRMLRKTEALMKSLGIAIPADVSMRQLSVAKMQLVEIIKAISLDSKVIIMDEPTSAITEKETEVLFSQIRALQAKGVAIIYISHKMDEIFAISDTITVLRDGKHVATKPVNELDEAALITMMVNRRIDDIYPKRQATIGEEILRVDKLSWGKRVKDVSFHLRKGEVLGVAGLVGAGRSELIETIFGIHRKDSGDVYIENKKVDIRHPQDAIAKGMALITEDRKRTGLNLATTVEENISLVALKSLTAKGMIKAKEEATTADRYIKLLDIKTPSRKTPVISLSGGNQQKVVLSKWLLSEPRIIFFDEPTRGIDVGAKREIYVLINELATQGHAIVMVSSELPELIGMSDRILVMREGEYSGTVEKAEFSQDLIMSYASRIAAR